MRALVFAVIVSAASCAAHVHLDAPPPADAPEVVRTSYYDTHRPRKAKRKDFEVRSRIGSDAPAIALKSVTLENGVRVEHVEDLQPLVHDDSATAQAIDEAVAARQRANWITGAGVGAGVVGIGVGGAMLVSEVAFNTRPQQQDIDTVPTTILIGGGALLAGLVVGGGLAAWGSLARDVEDDATTRAYRSLDEDLRARLALPPAETSTASR